MLQTKLPRMYDATRNTTAVPRRNVLDDAQAAAVTTLFATQGLSSYAMPVTKTAVALVQSAPAESPPAKFLRLARSNGLDEIQAQAILRLYASDVRACPEMRVMAKAYLARVNEKIVNLRSNRVLLEHLAGTCYGDDRSYCPILSALALRPQPSAFP